MAAPLVTTAAIVQALDQQFQTQIPGTTIEVFDVWPSDDTTVRYGVYVDDMHQVNKEPYQLGLTQGGGVYLVNDQVDITFISFKDDPVGQQVMQIISDLFTYVNPSTNRPLFDGYHQRNYSQDEEHGSRSVRHSWLLDLQRMEFI